MYLKKHYDSVIDISVLNTDFGLGVIKLKDQITQSLSIDEDSFNSIDKMTYDDMIDNPESILNLKSIENKESVLNTIISQHIKIT